MKHARFVFCIAYCIDIDLSVNGDDKWWLRTIDFLEIQVHASNDFQDVMEQVFFPPVYEWD